MSFSGLKNNGNFGSWEQEDDCLLQLRPNLFDISHYSKYEVDTLCKKLLEEREILHRTDQIIQCDHIDKSGHLFCSQNFNKLKLPDNFIQLPNLKRLEIVKTNETNSLPRSNSTLSFEHRYLNSKKLLPRRICATSINNDNEIDEVYEDSDVYINMNESIGVIKHGNKFNSDYKSINNLNELKSTPTLLNRNNDNNEKLNTSNVKIEFSSTVALKTASDIIPKTLPQNNETIINNVNKSSIKMPNLKRSATFNETLKRSKSNVVLKLSKNEKNQRQDQENNENLITTDTSSSKVNTTKSRLGLNDSREEFIKIVNERSLSSSSFSDQQNEENSAESTKPKTAEIKSTTTITTSKKIMNSAKSVGRTMNNVTNTKYVIFSNSNNTAISMAPGTYYYNNKTGNLTDETSINKQTSVASSATRSISSYSLDINNYKKVVAETRHLFDNIRVSGKRVSIREQSSKIPKITFEVTSNRFQDPQILVQTSQATALITKKAFQSHIKISSLPRFIIKVKN